MKIYTKRNERLVEEFEDLDGVQRLVGFADRKLHSGSIGRFGPASAPIAFPV
jgi:hypothetical protein